MKEQTMTSIDSELKEKAKEKKLNLSNELEEAIKRKIGQSIESEDDLFCHFCGIKDIRQSPEDLTKGLVWLCPDEVWICNQCLNKKKTKIIIGATEGI